MRSARPTASTPIPSLRETLTYFVRLLRLVRTYWGPMGRGIALGLIVGLAGLVTPYFSKLYFDNVYPARDVSLLRTIVIAVAAFSVASAIMGAVRGYYTQVVSARLSSAISLMYFNHLQHLPTRFFDEHRVGEVMSRLGDMRGALAIVSRVFQTLLVNGVYLVLVPPFLVALDWKLSIVALLTTPITVGVSTASSRVVRRFMKRTAEANAELSAIQVEALSQIRTLKAMALEHHVFRDSADQTQAALRVQLQAAGVGSLVGVINAVIRAAGGAVFAWLAWTLILRGEMSLGTFVAFSAYLGFLTGPAGQIAGLFADFQQSAITLGRAFEYLDIEAEQDPELAYLPPPAISHPIRGEIEFRSVTFGYTTDKPVIKDLSLRFESGRCTAIVGSSGAGKSTILRLLCRMEEKFGGAILVDGTPIEALSLFDLRQQIGVVWQEPTMLRGTIWQNLTIGADAAPRATVEEAVRICQLSDLIEALPSGFETMVAEWGATLSGGQRQRFALARALVRNPPVLLLDETTSQIDVRTEEGILRELLVRMGDRTVVIVTHRMATAAIADRIYVLEDGLIVGDGSHEELARDNGAYQAMIHATPSGSENRRRRLLGLT